MNKYYIPLQKILAISIILFFFAVSLKGQRNDQLYDLSIEELQKINIVTDSTAGNYSPSYEISIQDLMELEVIKELKVENFLDVSYDIPMEELMHVKLNVKRDTGIEPTYEMSLEGLTSLEVKEDVSVVDKISLSYDISLNGIMQISLKDIKKDTIKQ